MQLCTKINEKSIEKVKNVEKNQTEFTLFGSFLFLHSSEQNPQFFPGDAIAISFKYRRDLGF